MKTIGDRLTYCRSIIGLTRKELSEMWGQASIPTLSRWELDTIEPTSKKVASVAEFFCSKGLIVSSDWIIDGSGMAPSLLNMKEFTEDEFDDLCEQSFFNLNQKLKDFSYYKVTSNFFSPIIRYGDYIGGVKITNDSVDNINSLVFVVHENSVYVGFLEKRENLTIKNAIGKTMEFPHYSLLAKIHWTAIRP